MNEAEHKFRVIAEVSDNGVISADSDGVITYANSAAERIFSATKGELNGEKIISLLSPEDLPRFQAVLSMLYGAHTQEPAIPSAHYLGLNKKGQRIPLRISFARWQQNGFTCISIIVRDLTREEQPFREQIRLSEQKFRALAESSHDMIMQFDREHRHLYVNPIVKKFTGLDPELFIGKTHEELGITGELATLFREAIDHVFKTGETYRVKVPIRRTSMWLDWQVVPEFDPEGQVVTVMTSARDITELKKAEDEILKSLQKEKELGELKSRFISMTSHEFRTPMSTILSSAELLEQYADRLNAGKKEKLFGQIKNAISQMTQLLNDVLVIGKIEAGRMEFNPEWFDIKAFCRELMEELSASVGSRHRLHFNEPEEEVKVYLDKKLCRQIFGNLLSNAIKYSAQGSTVILDLKKNGDYLFFSVKDNGIGIPEGDRAQLFETFHRAANVGNISGTGLGMSIVKNALDMQKGRISFESVLGEGSTFYVELPLEMKKNGEAI